MKHDIKMQKTTYTAWESFTIDVVEFILNIANNAFVWTLVAVLATVRIYIGISGAKWVQAWFSRWLSFEEEMGSLEDCLFIINFYFLLFTWLIFSYLFIIPVYGWLAAGAFFLLTCLITVSVITPLSTIYDRGTFILNYIRGSAKTANVFVEFLLDILSISIISIRLLMQSIRYLLMLYVLYELYEWVWVTTPSSVVTLFTALFNSNLTESSDSFEIYSIILTFIFGMLKYIFYYFHFYIFWVVQSSAYLLISFWLFFFFYVVFFLTRLEKFTLYKKYIN